MDHKSACVASLSFEYEMLIGLERERAIMLKKISWIATDRHLVDQNFWICTVHTGVLIASYPI